MNVPKAADIDWMMRTPRLLAIMTVSRAVEAAAAAQRFPAIEDVVVKTLPGKEGSYRTAPIPAEKVITFSQTPHPQAEAALKQSRSLSAIGAAVTVAGTAWDAYRFHQAYKSDNKVAMTSFGVALAGDAAALTGHALLEKHPQAAAVTILVGHAVSSLAGVHGNLKMRK